MRAQILAFGVVAACLLSLIAIQSALPSRDRVFASAPDAPAAHARQGNLTEAEWRRPSDGSREPARLWNASATQSACPDAPPILVDGELRLALLVGVGDYRGDWIKDLKGPPGDVARMKRLLSAEGGFGFPEQNICELIDADATRANFEAAVSDWLGARARDNAQIVVFFAGHGSQLPDNDGDEDDQLDETYLFHDSGFPLGYSAPLRDDEFNALMLKLRAAGRDQKITVILDSCHSGTATRGVAARVAARSHPYDGEIPEAGSVSLTRVDGNAAAESWFQQRDGDKGSYVVLAAAADGSAALEMAVAGAGPDARPGVFTEALYAVLSRGGGQRPSYLDIEPEVRRLVRARSHQSPRFFGDVESEVFGEPVSERMFLWRVREALADGVVRLGSGPLPGAGPRAVFRIYDKDTPGEDFGDPAASKAQAEVTALAGGAATASVFGLRQGEKVEVDDYALLVNVGADYRKATFRIRPASDEGGVPQDVADRIRDLFSRDERLMGLFSIVDGFAPMELVSPSDAALQIIDPAGRVRNAFANDASSAKKVLRAFEGHARQSAIRQLSGERANMSARPVDVFIRERQPITGDADDPDCGPDSPPPVWPAHSDGVAVAEAPLCGVYEVWVRRLPDAPPRFQVGGLFMSANGETIALPTPNACRRGSRAGEPIDVSSDAPEVCLGRFQARRPVGIDETFMVFATNENAPVRWSLLEWRIDADGGRSATRGAPSPLNRALGDYVAHRSRSAAGPAAGGADEGYAVVSLPIRVAPRPD